MDDSHASPVEVTPEVSTSDSKRHEATPSANSSAAEPVDAEAQIAALRARQNSTRRATVAAMEEALYTPIQVLDHGFVRVIDYMGDDAAVVQAARVSYGTGTKRISNDRGLIRYLMRHRHTTPFEMCELKLHIKLPIFVARQWLRHRTANVNEYSARYSRLDREFYVPDGDHLQPVLEDRIARQRATASGMPDLFGATAAKGEATVLGAQSATNMQGRDGALADDEVAASLSRINWISKNAYGVYEWLLNEDEGSHKSDPERAGLARELARAVLPVNYYTQFYWKIDLHNLLHFLSLRADDHAQYEIRAYAEAIADVTRRWMPITFEAFEDYAMGAAHLSRSAMAVVRRMLAGESVTQEDSGLSKREWRELMATLDNES